MCVYIYVHVCVCVFVNLVVDYDGKMILKISLAFKERTD